MTMTKLLEQAVAEIEKLPEEAQDAIRWLHPYRHWCFVARDFVLDEGKAKSSPAAAMVCDMTHTIS